MSEIDDIDSVLAEVNRRLSVEQQIRKDDPLYTGLLLNKIALDSYLHLLQKTLDNALHHLNAASEQQVEKSHAIAEKLISRSAGNIERQLDAVAEHCEERIRTSGRATDTAVKRASRLAWAGAALIVIVACVSIGSCLGNLVFQLLHHIN
jgi:hypothetical protein